VENVFRTVAARDLSLTLNCSPQCTAEQRSVHEVVANYLGVFVFPALEQKGVSNVVLTKIVRTPGYRDKLPYSAIRLKPSSFECIFTYRRDLLI